MGVCEEEKEWVCLRRVDIIWVIDMFGGVFVNCVLGVWWYYF